MANCTQDFVFHCVMLQPFALCCLNSFLIMSGLCVSQHILLFIRGINVNSCRSVWVSVCWFMKPCCVSSWNRENRVIIQDVEEVPASLMCALAWIYTHLLLDNNTVFMSNDSVGWAWRRPEGGPAGTDSNTLLLSHTSALMHIVTPHTRLQHTHCLSPPHLSLLHTHSHNLCRPTKICQRVCMGFTSFTRAKERVAKFGEHSPSCRLTF